MIVIFSVSDHRRNCTAEFTQQLYYNRLVWIVSCATGRSAACDGLKSRAEPTASPVRTLEMRNINILSSIRIYSARYRCMQFVRLFVCLSETHRYSAKTAKYVVEILLPSSSAIFIVFGGRCTLVSLVHSAAFR